MYLKKNLKTKLNNNENSLNSIENTCLIKVEDLQGYKVKEINKTKDNEVQRKKSILKQKSINKIDQKERFKQEKEKVVKRVSRIVKEYNLDQWQAKYLVNILNIPSNP